MRTTVLNHFHTFHPEANAEIARLAKEEARIQVARARRGDVDPDMPVNRRRASERPQDLDAELADVRAKIDEQKAIVESGVVRLVVHGLPRGKRGGKRNTFRRMLAEHPPREGDVLDARLGYNSDTFGDELIQACILRTENLAGEPVENEWDKWADDMTDGQWEEIFRTCMSLNTEGNPTVFPR